MLSRVASRQTGLRQPPTSDVGNGPADVNGWLGLRVRQPRSARATREPSAWPRPSLEPPASLCDRQRLPPGLPCTFAPSRSTPSCAGVSGINRDTCQPPAETLTGILRDAFVVLQPNQHNTDGAPGGNRTPDLDVRTVLLYPLSYGGD